MPFYIINSDPLNPGKILRAEALVKPGAAIKDDVTAEQLLGSQVESNVAIDATHINPAYNQSGEVFQQLMNACKGSSIKIGIYAERVPNSYGYNYSFYLNPMLKDNNNTHLELVGMGTKIALNTYSFAQYIVNLADNERVVNGTYVYHHQKWYVASDTADCFNYHKLRRVENDKVIPAKLKQLVSNKAYTEVDLIYTVNLSNDKLSIRNIGEHMFKEQAAKVVGAGRSKAVLFGIKPAQHRVTPQRHIPKSMWQTVEQRRKQKGGAHPFDTDASSTVSSTARSQSL